jgi:hypothetical protein
MNQYYAGGDPDNSFAFNGYSIATLVVEVLRRCGDDFTREHLVEVVTHLHGVTLLIWSRAPRLATRRPIKTPTSSFGFTALTAHTLCHMGASSAKNDEGAKAAAIPDLLSSMVGLSGPIRG